MSRPNVVSSSLVPCRVQKAGVSDDDDDDDDDVDDNATNNVEAYYLFIVQVRERERTNHKIQT